LGDEGTVVILIHGLGGSVENWMYNINTLAQHHRVYAIDLAGFGRSDKTSVLSSFSKGAQFVNNFMEIQHINRASLVGHSMGGGVTLQFAIQFPDKIEKMVLVDSAGLGREIHLLVRLISLPFIGELLTRPSRRGTVQLLKTYIYDPALITDELIELVYQLAILPDAQKSFLLCLRSGINSLGLRTDTIRSIIDNLTNIVTPTLVIWGKQDKILPLSHGYLAEERIPNAELHILDPCGHIPQMERPEDINKLILGFLTS
jgi:4,5:9,10-diseco-3-hydroxy-5,9,17-trioxoandrosta-1(10),2-diene-4-oate hydrolase